MICKFLNLTTITSTHAFGFDNLALDYCRGVDLSTWRDQLEENGEKADMEKFVRHVHSNHFIPNTVIVDCTADSSIASHYHDWLRRGIHVVTPNKKANSGPLEQVRSNDQY